MDQDKLATYRRAILALLDRYRDLCPSDAAVETYQVIDRENDHYQLLSDALRGRQRVLVVVCGGAAASPALMEEWVARTR